VLGDLTLFVEFLNFHRRQGVPKHTASSPLKSFLACYKLNNSNARRIREKIFGYFKPLLIWPDTKIIGEITCKGGRKPPTESTKSVMHDSYSQSMESLLLQINQQLNCQLEVAIGDKEVIKYHSEFHPLYSDIRFLAGNDRGIISKKYRVENPLLRDQASRGRGPIRTHCGNFLVLGEVPDLDATSATAEKHLFWIIAKALIKGKDFTRLRLCRKVTRKWECQTVFFYRDYREVSCEQHKDLYVSNRVAKRRKEEDFRKSKKRRHSPIGISDCVNSSGAVLPSPKPLLPYAGSHPQVPTLTI